MGQRVYRFDNGYGASVIDDGYGKEEGLFELAVFDNRTKQIVYDSGITDDVLGWLTQSDVDNLLAQIKALPPR